MRMGDILLARGLVSAAGIDRAVARQRSEGGRLGDNLIALGLLTPEQLDAVIHDTPTSPRRLADAGLPAGMLEALALKLLLRDGETGLAGLAAGLCLPMSLTEELAGRLSAEKLALRDGDKLSLNDTGRAAAEEAFERNGYLGPAPVPLAAYQEQVLHQRISNEVLDAAAVRAALAGMVVPDAFVRKIGPAINGGRAVLLYGPAGNGKTAIAGRLARAFRHIVYVPHAVEIEGQVMTVFDPALHKPAASLGGGDGGDDFDRRWVACSRPFVAVGGELALDMLDLAWDAAARAYRAPLHVKALNGTLLVDDFGRQQAAPDKLLNRWIMPLESRLEFLRLNTGRSFYLPFDALMIFATNLQPDELMDQAHLRRIPYKIELQAPDRAAYRRIFDELAAEHGLAMSDEVFETVVGEIEGHGLNLAYHQPRAICDQVVAACRYEGLRPQFTPELLSDALANLYVEASRGTAS